MVADTGLSNAAALPDNTAPLATPGSEPAAAPKIAEKGLSGGRPSKKDKLPAKTIDLSRYLDQAQLTDRQRECFSLRFEYEMKLSAIAKWLGLSRKTIDEHIAAARRRMDWSEIKEKMKTNKRRLNPGE
jgi:DNA-directed RNA polymerase specialized sigma24 family protein